MRKRVSCHERIKQLRKQIGYKPVEQKIPKASEIPEIHIKYSKKEVKKFKKAKEKAVEQRMWTLFLTYDDKIQDMLLKMSYDDMVNWIVEMERVIEDASKIRKVDERDVFCEDHLPNRMTSDDDLFAIPASQWEAYGEFIKHRKMEDASDIVKARCKFLSKIEKRTKKYRKGGLNMYDPLFHGSDVNMQEMKRNLKRLTEDNKKRVEAFLSDLEKLTGRDVSTMPAVKSFKDKSDKILKQANKYIDSMGVGSTELTIDF